MAIDRPASPALSLSSAAELLLLSAIDKPPVVLDVGSRVLKAGFVGEAAPRRLSMLSWPTPSTSYTFLNSVQETLHTVFFLYLQCNPKERKVVVLLSVMSPFVLKTALAEILFQRFECPGVLFLDSEIHTPLPLRLSSALVLDCGNTLSRVLPVHICSSLRHIYSFRVLHSALVAAPIAQQALHASLNERLQDQVKGNQLSQDVLEGMAAMVPYSPYVDLCARVLIAQVPSIANVPPLKYRLPSGQEITIAPAVRTGAVDPLFDCDEDVDDEPSIPALVLNALQKCPVDTRLELCRSILPAGGLAHLPGFNERLIASLKVLCDTKYPAMKALKDEFAVLPSPYPSAVVGALESEQWITSAFYAQNKGSLPDWTSLKVADTVF